MDNLKQNVLQKYNLDVKKYMENELLKKGFIKSDNGVILKLDVFEGDFKVIGINEIADIVDNEIANLWNIPPGVKEEIIYETIMELLPFATKSEIDNYLLYCKTEMAMIDEDRLKSDLKKLLNSNKKKHKKVFQGGYQSPEYQSQALINANVIYDENVNGYYIYDKNIDRFKKLSKSDVMEILNNEFKGFNKCGIDLIDIYDNMKVQYFMFITNSAIPKIYNQNKDNQKVFQDLKGDFKKMEGIISHFE